VTRAATKSLLLTALTLALALPATFFLLYLRFSGARAGTLSSVFVLLLGSTPLILSGSLLLRFFSFPNPLLPALALSLHLTAFWHRALSRQLDRRLPLSSVQGGRARGFTASRVFLRDLLAPSLGSFIAYFGTQIGVLLNGSLLIEVLFQWNGLGSLIAESVLSRDYPVLDAAILAAALLTLFCQQLGYSIQKWWDPEIS
jgi:peptide/nickel transport system permease protein